MAEISVIVPKGHIFLARVAQKLEPWCNVCFLQQTLLVREEVTPKDKQNETLWGRPKRTEGSPRTFRHEDHIWELRYSRGVGRGAEWEERILNWSVLDQKKLNSTLYWKCLSLFGVKMIKISTISSNKGVGYFFKSSMLKYNLTCSKIHF